MLAMLMYLLFVGVHTKDMLASFVPTKPIHSQLMKFCLAMCGIFKVYLVEQD